MTDPVSVSASTLARGIREGRWTPVEVVQAHIDRIRTVNPELNAVVAPRYEEALREAEDAQGRVASGASQLPPLLGVPFTVKEFVAVRGMPHTGGMLARSHAVASDDATVVARLRRAGGIVLGVTNAPEAGLWHETSNPVYGRTRNPHDLHRTSGGSSGGEGAIVAAGGSPLGIGSDVGGSVRIPAGFCGIASHKPTGGLVPDTGHFPPAPAGDDAPMVLGPMARHVEDLELVLGLIAGPDDRDPRAGRYTLSAAPPTLHGMSVFALPSNGRTRPTPEVAAAVWKAARSLEAQGARLVEWSGPDLSQAFELWMALLAESGARYDELLSTAERQPRPLRQAVRWLLGRADHSGSVIAILLLERALGWLPGDLRALAREARQLRGEVDRVLGDLGVILHPVYPRTAPRHRAIALRAPWDIGCTALFNVTEGPVTTVRVDTDPRGLPIGVQVGGSRGRDRLTLAAARILESDFGTPMPVDPRWGRRAPLGLRLA